MKNMDILIVEDDKTVADRLKKHLILKEDVHDVEWVPSVQEARLLLEEKEIDVVVLDLIMASYDGYAFLENVDKIRFKNKPDVIVTSAIAHDSAIKKAFDMGAKYYMIKPYENEIVYRRICDVRDIETIEEPVAKNEKSLEQKVTEIFLTLGIPPHLKGYQYLRESIKIAVDDPSAIYGITKLMYPKIAEKYNVTSTKVELAIRHTLEVTWQRNKLEKLNTIFGYPVYINNSKPTNGEFIALVADKLLTDKK